MSEDREDFPMPDARERVLGTLPLAINHRVEGMAHARVLRSPEAHARIRSIDVREAQKHAGVIAVLTGRDLAEDHSIEPFYGPQEPDQPILAIDKVRYAGEAVALVVAEDARRAAEALIMIDVDYEQLPVVGDLDAAVSPDAPLVHDDKPGNVCRSWKLRHGDIDEGFRLADRIYEDVYTSPPASHVPMEPHVAVARWTEDAVEVWTAAQAPYMVQKALCGIYGLEPDSVRVRTFNLGGAYGSKGDVKIEPLATAAARLSGRPVRLELSREEVFCTVAKHASQVLIRTGVTKDGDIVAREMDVQYNAGAYSVTSPRATAQGLVRAPGPYHIPNVWIDATSYYTNTVPTGPFRGAMTSQVTWAYESQLDDIALDLGIDGLELRRRNCLRDGDVYATGERMKELFYGKLLDSIAAGVDWGTPSAPSPPGTARGKGLAIMIKSTITPSRSEARLQLDADGSVTIWTSSVEMGQGSHATLAQIAARDLGIEPAALRVSFADTAETPFDTITASSRTTYAMGNAVRRAATALRARIAQLAASHWGVEPHSVTVVDGGVRAARGKAPISYDDVLDLAGLTSISAVGVYQSYGGTAATGPEIGQDPVTPHWHQGGASAEVEVDLETGVVTILRLHGAVYAGRMVSPVRVRQQSEGSAIFAMGPTMFEELTYEDGQMLNPNFADYMIPSIHDIPVTLTSEGIENADPDAELHGVGEMTVPAVAPAIGNAIKDALGIRIRALPMTPERVLRAVLGQPESGGADDR